MSSCGHEWHPVPGWNGRYRCRWCKGLAYKHIVTGGMRGNILKTEVYVCRHDGCGEPAVVGPRKGQLCAAHVKPEDRPKDVNVNP